MSKPNFMSMNGGTTDSPKQTKSVDAVGSELGFILSMKT